MRTIIALALAFASAAVAAYAAEKPKYPDVPMTRPEEMLAELKTNFVRRARRRAHSTRRQHELHDV